MPRRPFILVSGEDPCPDLPVELGADDKGVGRWVPDQKHTLVAKWLGGTTRAWAKWPQRIFIDPFCGPGRIRVRDEKITRDGGSVVAYRESLRLKAPFTNMLVGDIKKERVNANAARLRAIGASVTPFVGPASETIKQMIDQVPKGTLALAYLDPYNLEYLSFDIIETLAKLRVDFTVHFSTMDLQRNVDMELDEKRARFDDAAPGWRHAIGTKPLSLTQLRQEFFEYWCSLVRGLGFKIGDEMPLVVGYRLVFFSRSELAIRVWSDVAKSSEKSLRLPF